MNFFVNFWYQKFTFNTGQISQKNCLRHFFTWYTVKFFGMSPVQLPNNSGAGPGKGRGTARDYFEE